MHMLTKQDEKPNPYDQKLLLWLHTEPERVTRHHHARLKRTQNPLTKLAYKIILQGPTAVVDTIDNDPILGEFFHKVLVQNRHPKRAKRTPPKAKQAESEPYPDLEPGRGKWPKIPQHTCGQKSAAGTRINMYTKYNVTNFIKFYTPKWRDCPACYHERVKRYSRQVLYELSKGPLKLTILESKQEHTKFAGRVRQDRKRKGLDISYLAMPQDDGRCAVVHNRLCEGGQEITINDRTAVFNLLHPWLHTPEDRRISSSKNGFGGNWQGARGDGRIKAAKKAGLDVGLVQLWTRESLHKIAGLFNVDLHDKGIKFSVQQDTFKVYKKLIDEGIELHARNSSKTAYEAFQDAHVTDNAYNLQEKNNPKDIGVKRDKLPKAPPKPQFKTSFLPGFEPSPSYQGARL